MTVRLSVNMFYGNFDIMFSGYIFMGIILWCPPSLFLILCVTRVGSCRAIFYNVLREHDATRVLQWSAHKYLTVS